MVVPFGISVGDFIATISLLLKAVKSLSDSSGSSAEYRGILLTLKSLEEALKQAVQVDNPQHQAALQGVCDRCAESIDGFVGSLDRFGESLKEGGSGKKWKDRMRDRTRKIQWGVCSKEDVRRFQAELQAHTTAIKFLLLKTHMNASASSHRDASTALIRLQSSVDEQNLAQAIVFKAILRCWAEFRDLFMLVLMANCRIFEAIAALHDRIATNEVHFDKPAVFEDAHGRLFPIHLQWTDSWEAFEDILRCKFKNVPGLGKVLRGEYILRDSYSATDVVVRSRPFEHIFRPGRRIDMSVIFQFWNCELRLCPRCRTPGPDCSEKDMTCPSCGLWYRWSKQEEIVDIGDTPERRFPGGSEGQLSEAPRSPPSIEESSPADFSRVRLRAFPDLPDESFQLPEILDHISSLIKDSFKTLGPMNGEDEPKTIEPMDCDDQIQSQYDPALLERVRQIMLREQQEKKRDEPSSLTDIPAASGQPRGRPTLLDYQLQLMLLSQQNQKRILLAKGELEREERTSGIT
ncbi:hypothetical protein BCR34DRAFT_554139 [Clohesyomyces aquaticus]|uniref:Ubiquitin-like domain-containing protein n=1 Tax=Clohesyomyces aquaticus TaxID=1231657 RepID=A0A1Y2A7U5_9PLEO|nr:hypothetical protein BCR34DRAFT_554139 [Clohesyomyces aquaticus]